MINLLAVQFALLLLLTNLSHAAEWKTVDMNPGEVRLPREPTSITPDCDGPRCGYDVHFFKTQSSTPRAKTILYISGGPGQIVDRTQPDLDAVKDKFNVVYFDIRGAGLSAPPNAVDNSTDKFLRAKFVIKDIEEIRKKVIPNDGPWDAIYGHSAGTLFAQLYAEQFGISRVKTLILSAPISRHIDNEPFRAAMIATNLKNILENNADPVCLFTSTRVEKIREKVASILAARLLEGGGRSETFLKESNNFCFLNPSRIAKITVALEDKLKLITETFGSISFVMENHDDLKKNDRQFSEAFPYPDIFFPALKTLDRLGSPTRKTADLFLVTRSLAVDAALVLGYYLDSPKPEDVERTKCNPKAAFFKTLNPDADADVANTIYCDRFDTAAKLYELGEPLLAKQRSERAADVFGIKDGIHRWPVRLMPAPPQSCNRGSEFIALASNPADDHKRTARNLLKRVGFESGEDICPWDPAQHKHNVPALVLKGKQDAATNGCQAEHLFKEGLLNANKRFVEFPQFGHDWISEIKPERKGNLATLLVSFIDAPAQFGRSPDVRRAMKNLGANFGTPASFARSGC